MTGERNCLPNSSGVNVNHILVGSTLYTRQGKLSRSKKPTLFLNKHEGVRELLTFHNSPFEWLNCSLLHGSSVSTAGLRPAFSELTRLFGDRWWRARHLSRTLSHFKKEWIYPPRVWIYPPRVWIHVPSHAIKQPMQPRWVPPSPWAQVPWVARAVTMMEQPRPTPTQGQPGSLLMVRALSLHRLSSSVNTALPFSSQGLANCCKGQTRNSSCSTGHRRSVTLTPSFSLLFILFVLRAPPSPLTTF